MARSPDAYRPRSSGRPRERGLAVFVKLAWFGRLPDLCGLCHLSFFCVPSGPTPAARIEIEPNREQGTGTGNLNYRRRRRTITNTIAAKIGQPFAGDCGVSHAHA